MSKFVPVFFHKNFEDLPVKTGLDSIFKKKRGYDFKMPEKGEPVLLIVSGGLDSTMLWFNLLHTYGLHVYPIHFVSKRSILGEKWAVRFFYHFFKKRYPDLVKPIQYIPIDLSFSLTNRKNSRMVDHNLRFVINNLRHNKITKKKDFYLIDYPVRYAYYLLAAYEYGLSLQARNIPVYSIFIGVVPNDGLIGRESTLTVLRALNVYLCCILGDWRWQLTGPVEQKRNFFYPKETSIAIGVKNDIPLEKTWSCGRRFFMQCGICNACRYRHHAFRDAHIEDKTVYFFHPSYREFVRNIVFYVRDFVLKRLLIRNTAPHKRYSSFTKIKGDLSALKISLSSPIETYEEGRFMYLRNKETDEIVRLNKMGGMIITILEKRGGTKLSSLISSIFKSYPSVSPKQIEGDAVRFLKDLERRHTISGE